MIHQTSELRPARGRKRARQMDQVHSGQDQAAMSAGAGGLAAARALACLAALTFCA
jgi:hypothetical protein